MLNLHVSPQHDGWIVFKKHVFVTQASQFYQKYRGLFGTFYTSIYISFIGNMKKYVMLLEQFSILDGILRVQLYISRPQIIGKVSTQYIFCLCKVSKPDDEQYLCNENLHLQFLESNFTMNISKYP